MSTEILLRRYAELQMEAEHAQKCVQNVHGAVYNALQNRIVTLRDWDCGIAQFKAGDELPAWKVIDVLEGLDGIFNKNFNFREKMDEFRHLHELLMGPCLPLYY